MTASVGGMPATLQQLFLPVEGPFSLAQSIAFVDSFVPASAPQDDAARLRLALVDDGGVPVFFAAAAEGRGVVVDYASDLPEPAVAAHVARVLSIDVDGRAFATAGRADPVLGALRARYPGRRPVCFGTPFEAAVWAVLSQRVAMRQAARLKAELAVELGAELELDGQLLRAFPAPDVLAELESFPGLWGAKAERIRGLARAALAGDLDPEALRALEPDAALEHLTSLPGIGPFSAALILVRGAGHPDVLPGDERRLRRAVALAYGLGDRDATAEELAAISDGWRPFRSWAAFLLRNWLDDPDRGSMP
jgi:DNA-3-methyladenine glycosylase II